MSLETLKNKNKKKNACSVLPNNLQTRTVRCKEVSFSFIDLKAKPNAINNTYLAKSDKTRKKKKF